MAWPDTFKVYDYTFFSGKPSPAPGQTATVYDRIARGLIPGTEPLQAESRVWRANSNVPTSYSKENCQNWAETLDDDIPVVIDTEAVLGSYSADEIDNTNRIVQDIKAVNRRLRVGCYNALPRKTGAWNWAVYGEAGEQALYSSYEARNVALRTKPRPDVNRLSLLVDFIVADCYLELPGEWGLGLNTAFRPAWPKYIQRFVGTHVAMAKTFGKPVYAAAFFDIHGGGSDGDLWGVRLPDNCIDVYLASLFSCADGMMIWGGSQFTPPATQNGDPSSVTVAWSTQSSWSDRLAVYL